MKTFCYVRLPHNELISKQCQFQVACALAEKLGYEVVENEDSSQQDRLLSRISMMPKQVLHGMVIAFRG